MGLFTYNKAQVQRRYSANPENFAYGQGKVWGELSPLEKASSLFQEYADKGASIGKEVGTQMVKSATETGAALLDVGTRLSPFEGVRNVIAGAKETINRAPGVPAEIAFEKGYTEDRARPLLLEKVTGEQLQNQDGTVNWDFARKFVGRAMEGPTYAYAGTVQAAKLAEKGLLSRVLTRSVSTVPEAGINTALQAGEEGSTENLGTTFLANALLMSGVSNLVGEIKLSKDVINETVSGIEGKIGKLSPEEKVDIEEALKQGVKPSTLIENVDKVAKNEVTPQEVAEKVNTVYRGQPAEAGEHPTGARSYTPDKALAEKYADLNKDVTGKTEVVAADVSDKNIKEVTQQEFLSASEDPTIRESFDGLKFTKEGETTPTYILFDKPALKTEGASATVTVPRTQTPVGTGQEKVSRLEARVTGNLGKLSPEEIDTIGLSTYRQMNKADQIKSAAEYVTNNPDDALKVLSGEIDPPKGLLKNSVYVAMENAAHDDAALGRKLASLSSTRMGQELSILSEVSEDSPVKAMREVSQARIQATERRLKSGSVPKAQKTIVKSIKEHLKKNLPKQEDWSSFVDSIRCRT